MTPTSMVARRTLALVAGLALAMAAAQTPAETLPVELPVRHLVLFTNGVGYFEHVGTVVGTQEVDLPVAPEHMDDLLQSLVVRDLGGGRVEAARYGARDPLGRLLASYGLDLSGDPTLAQILSQARGEAVRVETSESIRGVIVNVERVTVPDQAPRSLLTLATDGGLRRLDLDEVRSVAFESAALQAELDAALAAIARYRGGGDAASVRLRFVGEGTREVRVAYVREMPVWKASYRLGIGEAGRAELQGWAILDNPTALDLDGVSVWFVAGQPLSFIASLFEPVYVDRPRVGVATAPSLAPQVDAGQFAAPSARMFAAPAPAMMADAVAEAATAFFDGRGGVEAAAEGVAGGATFAYRVSEPVRVGRFESAMIPIVVADVEAHAVSWFDAGVLPGHPLRAVRLVNDTGLHLAAGPVTVFDEGGFAGQAMMADVVPGDARMLAYAVDLDVAVVVATSSEPESVVAVSLRGSVLESSWRSRLTTSYRLEPRADADRFVVVEHPKRAGFAVASPEGPAETPDAWRFGVALGADAAADPTVPTHLACDDDACVLTVVMERVDGRRVALSNVGGDQLAFFLQNVELSDEDREALTAVLAAQRRMAELDREIVALEARVNDVFRDQARIRDNMAALERNSTLYRRYLADLETQENELGRLRDRIAELRTARVEAQRALDALIEGLAAGAVD